MKLKHSEDLTILVENGTNTVTVKDNLSVFNDLTVDNNAVISGELTCDTYTGDVNFTDNVSVEGTFTGDDVFANTYKYSEAKYMNFKINIGSLYESSLSSYWTNAEIFKHATDDDIVIRTSGAWEVIIKLDGILPHYTATSDDVDLTGINFVMSQSGPNTATVTCKIQRTNYTGAVSVFSDVQSKTADYTSASSTYQTLGFVFDSPVELSTYNYGYRLVLSATSTGFVYIHRISGTILTANTEKLFGSTA
jgi:hypothetical protein